MAMTPDDLTPEQRAAIQALMAKNAQPVSSPADPQAALLQDLQTPTAGPAPASAPAAPADSDDGLDSFRSALNNIGDKASLIGTAEAQASQPNTPIHASDTPTPETGVPLTGQALADAIKKDHGPVATTGFNPNNPGPEDNRVAAPAAPADDSEDDEDAPAAGKAKAPSTPPGQPAQNLSSLLSRLTGQQPQAPAGPSPMDQLAAAQKQVQQNQMIANLGKAGETIAGGISRGAYKPDNAFYDDLAKTAGQAPVTNLLQKQAYAGVQTEQALKNYQLADEKEKNDSSSAASQLAQNVLTASMKQIGMPVPPGINKMSASSIEKTAPWVSKMIDAKISNDMRLQVAQQNALMRQQMMGNKASVADQKELQALAKSLDSSGPRAGNFGKAGAMSMAADRINAILQQFPDGNVPKAQTEELATAAAALVGGGSAQSQQQINSVVPHSLAGDASAWAGYLKNNPDVMHQPAFIKNLAESAAREKAVAEQQMNDIKVERLSSHNGVANRLPEDFGRVLSGAHLDPAAYDMKSGAYKKATPQPAARTPQASGAPAQQLPANKPPVVQNGHTYTWNPTSGQYE